MWVHTYFIKKINCEHNNECFEQNFPTIFRPRAVIFIIISKRIRQHHPAHLIDQGDEQLPYSIHTTNQFPFHFNGFLNDRMHHKICIIIYRDYLKKKSSTMECVGSFRSAYFPFYIVFFSHIKDIETIITCYVLLCNLFFPYFVKSKR